MVFQGYYHLKMGLGFPYSGTSAEQRAAEQGLPRREEIVLVIKTTEKLLH